MLLVKYESYFVGKFIFEQMCQFSADTTLHSIYTVVQYSTITVLLVFLMVLSSNSNINFPSGTSNKFSCAQWIEIYCGSRTNVPIDIGL
jgi:hypothetical protein